MKEIVRFLKTKYRHVIGIPLAILGLVIVVDMWWASRMALWAIAEKKPTKMTIIRAEGSVY